MAESGFSRPVAEVMRERFSCRTYSGEPLAEDARARLARAAGEMRTGPFGSALRCTLVAAAPGDESALKGLGTYGTIRGAAAFLIGAAEARGSYLVDFGFAFERLILQATDLGLGTCWLGGFFSRGSFSRRIRLGRGERIPSVACVGMIPDPDAARQGVLRVSVGGSRRKPWEELFFDQATGRPLAPQAAGPCAEPLEMARIAPSASNRQPWRVARDGQAWHFHLQRTPGYPGRLPMSLLGIEDIQVVDIGIAMCHFDLSARDRGLSGAWTARSPAPAPLDRAWQYVATWEEGGGR
jgi:hypothetical protein